MRLQGGVAECGRLGLLAALGVQPAAFDLEAAIPDAWALLEADVPCTEKKTKVTLYLDASTATFFRTMGQGYQERINRLLTFYAQAKIAEVRWFAEAIEREMAAVRREVEK